MRLGASADPREFVQQSKASAGPTMLFATIVPLNPSTKAPWTDDEVDALASQWSDVRSIECIGVDVAGRVGSRWLHDRSCI